MAFGTPPAKQTAGPTRTLGAMIKLGKNQKETEAGHVMSATRSSEAKQMTTRATTAATLSAVSAMSTKVIHITNRWPKEPV